MTNRQPTVFDKIRYKFDSSLSRGPVSVVAWLAGVTLGVILLSAAVLAFISTTPEGAKPTYIEGFWQSLLRAMDPGTMGGDQGWPFRIASLLITFAGIFIFSTLIGLIASGIDQKLEEIRKGRTEVLETGHTLILGWSPKLFTILSELVIANESEKRSSVVVMAPHSKIEMEDEIRERIGTPKTKIVCRTGDPASPADLELVHPLKAKAVIVLGSEDESSDARVIKCVLALARLDPGFDTLRVVAEMSDVKNQASLAAATRGRVNTLISDDVIARITAQVCRASGLSAVYQDLLDFSGDEIYFHVDSRLDEMSFSDALFAFEGSCVIGIRSVDGTIRVKPEMDTVFKPGDAAILIASDDAAIRWSSGALAPVAIPVLRAKPDPLPENTLILGWNALGRRVLRQLDSGVAPGSVAHLAFDPALVADEVIGIGDGYRNLEVSIADTDTNDATALTEVLSQTRFDHILILCYRHGISQHDAEARALMTLVQVRQILNERGIDMSIVTELLDIRDVELARVANPDDYIVSQSLTSLMLAQLSENPELSTVFTELFDPEGAELALVPAAVYLDADATFADAVASARGHGDVAVGVRGEDGIRLNPPMGAAVGVRDSLVVLS